MVNLNIVSFLKKRFYFNRDKNHKIADDETDTANVIAEADRLFENKDYAEVYALLNHSKFHTNSEVLWRISRALFKLSTEVTLARQMKSEMLDEASRLIDTAMSINEENCNVHKWMAIIVDAKYGCEGTAPRVAHAHVVKRHLTRATELDPQDYSLWYMLGHWHYSMSHLTWLQRKIAYFLYSTPPEATYDEAYQYFLKAEELKPRYYIPNIYMLGKVSYHLKQHFRARYYLNIAANLHPHDEYEKKCIRDAKALDLELELFDLTKNAIFSDFLS